MYSTTEPEWVGTAPDEREIPFYEQECDVCNISADCIFEHVPYCAEHAHELFFDQIDTLVDPAEEGFLYSVDVRVDEGYDLTAFAVTWEKGGAKFSVEIPIESVLRIKSEVER